MSWITCRWCPKRLNGDSNRADHERSEHPNEYKRADLVHTLKWANERLTTNQRDSNMLEECQRFLAVDKDYPLIHDVVETNYFYQHAMRLNGRVQQELARSKQYLAEAQAALASFDAQHPELAVTS